MAVLAAVLAVVLAVAAAEAGGEHDGRSRSQPPRRTARCRVFMIGGKFCRFRPFTFILLSSRVVDTLDIPPRIRDEEGTACFD
jgi:hypothetical protein